MFRSPSTLLRNPRSRYTKLSRALTLCNIEAVPLQPECDRFKVIGGHDEDYALAIANAGTREQGDCLLDVILIHVWVHNVGA